MAAFRSRPSAARATFDLLTHDCFTASEVITHEGLGLCPEGGAEKFIEDGDNTYGGRFVTNPSGGLLPKGQSPRRHGARAVHRSSCGSSRAALDALFARVAW